jgi:glycosyltransferase involved in cell wall biosynthesis
MKKIAFFLPSMRGGGAERVMATLAREFANLGHDVDMILASAEGPYLSELGEGVRVISLNKKCVSYSLIDLVKYLKKEKPDVLLSSLNNANIVSIVAKKIANTKTRVIIRQANTLSLNQLNISGKIRVRDRVLPSLVRYIYPYADVVVAVSNGVKSDLIEYAGIDKNKIVVIYNPVIDSKIYERALEDIDHPWLQDRSSPVILSVGRLNRQKDYETLIRAVEIVAKHMSIRLIILGEGGERRSLEKMVADKQMSEYVSMPGFVDNPFPFIKQADVFVLSSIFEGLPNVLIQSLALGTPVISTDCPYGPREILEDGLSGRLVPVQNPSMLASSLLNYFAKSEDILGATSVSLSRFCVATCVKKYFNLIEFLKNE